MKTVVESIDVADLGVAADFFAGIKRAGHHAGRAASEAWGSSKTAVQGARSKRRSSDDDDSGGD